MKVDLLKPSLKSGVLGIVTIILILMPAVFPTEKIHRETLIREEFTTLDAWDELKFPKIDRMSTYSIERTVDGSTFLRADSDNAASALVWKEDFDVYEFPRLRWRWKVSNVFRTGDARKKKGDDYPLRIDVMFKYDASDPAVRKGLKYSMAKLIYGQYPPYSSLNYIWANRETDSRYMVSTYTKSTVMVALQQGERNTGLWLTEDVDILEDYREAFGEDPPRIAGIAVMSDTDNTGESCVSWVDWIEIYRIIEDER